MLGENIKHLRISKGFSQEELASRLHVVRQTVSKWEKGLSVPDADLLVRLAELFEVPVSRLLGGPIEAETDQPLIAEQLARINEQLAVKNRRARRIWRAVIITLAAVLLLSIIWLALSWIPYQNVTSAPDVEAHETVVND